MVQTQGKLPERMQRKFCCFCKKELKSLDGHVKTQYGPVCPTCFDAMKYCHFCKKELKSLDDHVKTYYGMVCIPCYDKNRGGRPKKIVDKRKLLKLRRKGKSIREIAKELNASVGTVHNRLREGGAEERYLRIVTNNPGITTQGVLQILRRELWITENYEKTLLWKQSKEVDDLGTKGYWRIQKDEAQSEKQDFAIEKNATEYAERGGRPKKEIDRERLFQLKKEGKTLRGIAKELNISHTSVRNKLKELQYPSK